MCGIFGAISFDDYFDDRDYARFLAATQLVDYRGPDGWGVETLACKQGEVGTRERFDVFLGHRRLAIIDLSENGRQPMRYGDKLWITFNGEIYNYIELREQLIREKGCQFRTRTDTEVIPAQYQCYGPGAFNAFNGMWAFALVDLEKREVVLSRDRFSEKPLYYCRQGSCFYFASEIKQLLPFVTSVEVNRSTMMQYLDQGLIDAGEDTFFHGIQQVRAKHNMLISLPSGQTRQEPYWDYVVREEKRPVEETMQEFDALLTDSIRLRLRSDVPVATLLSGGLDSSTIATISNEFAGGHLVCYSVIANERKYSESRFIDTLVQATGIPSRQFTFTLSDVFDCLDDVLYHNDEPPGGLSAVAHYRMMQVIKKETNATVLLSGQGGDEILLGYRKFYFFHLLNLLRQYRFLQLSREILGSLYHRTVLLQFDLAEARRYLPSCWQKQPSYLRGRFDREPIEQCCSIAERQQMDLDRFSVPNLTHYEDRNSMAFGLEIRLPFLDSRLVDFALSLPTDQKIRHGWTKYILRRSQTRLPKSIRWRRDKQSFIQPEEMWVKHDLANIIRESMNSSVLAEMGLLDSKAFLEHYDNFQAGKRHVWYAEISRVLLAELWAQKFFGERQSTTFEKFRVNGNGRPAHRRGVVKGPDAE